MPSVLTAEIAEQFCDDEDSVDLNTFTGIEPEAATLLGRSYSDLHLNGLTTLEPDVARSLAGCEGDVSLNGLRELAVDVAASFAHHVQGALSCDGLEQIADEAARMLMRHPGHISLRGISALSQKAAHLFAFAPRKFTLGCSLPASPSIRDLSALWGAIGQFPFLTTAWPAGTQMLFAVGTQHRAQDVVRAIEMIKQSGSFLPPRAMLVPEPTNAHDPNAVAVIFPTQQFGQQGRQYGADIKVGYLQRGTAVLFRETCAALGLGDAPVEVLACILVGKGPDEAGTIKVYLPNNFGELVVSGYTSEPSSQLAWLADAAPVPKKEVTQNRAKDYTLDEQRKMYCRYAQYKGWNCLPDSVEDKLAAWQSGGLGPVGLAWAFHQEGVDSFETNDRPTPSVTVQGSHAGTGERIGGHAASVEHLPHTGARDRPAVTSRGDAKPANRGVASGRLDAREVARAATLKTLFKAWAKWKEDVASPAARTHLRETTATILAAGDAVFLARYRGILEEEFEVAQEKADEKESDRARAGVFEQLLERVRKATELCTWPGIDDAFEDFEIQCEAWTM
jgi:hypothetical protein